MFYYYHNHDQLIKGKSTKSLNDQEFSSKKYRYQYWYRKYWPCNYLVSDRCHICSIAHPYSNQHSTRECGRCSWHWSQAKLTNRNSSLIQQHRPHPSGAVEFSSKTFELASEEDRFISKMVVCFYLQTLALIEVEEICFLIFFFFQLQPVFSSISKKNILIATYSFMRSNLFFGFKSILFD